jgi:hypothetical protein
MTAARKPRRGIWLAAALAAALPGGGVAWAGAGMPGFIVTAGCQEHQAFVDGDEAAVAGRLPKRYTPELDPRNGRPLLFARALRCQSVTLDGRSAPATMGSFGIVIESPDGRGCGSGAPGFGSAKGDVPPACNWYTLFWLADNRRVVNWLRDGTAFPAVYVPKLVFDLGGFDPALGGAPFHFEAPAPAPSPFTIDEIGREHPGELSVRGGYWVDTPQGTVKLALSTDDLTTGDGSGVVRARPGSGMAKLFGANEQSYAPGYSSIAAERWGHASYRKQLLGPPRPGEQLDRFSGSCSLQGSNAFSPPITNTQQMLSLSYDGSGTCSGTLNGRDVSNAPVRMHNTGTSDGSCLRARTLAPAKGAITFPDGTTIRYTFDFTFVLSEGDITFYGQRSGTAHGHGSFVTQRTPSDVTLKCGGEGEKELPLDITLTTDSPLVSARTAASRRDYKAPRIRLAGVPRKRCARGFRARVRIAERWSGLRRARLSLDGRRLLVTRKKRFSRRIPARRPGPARHRLKVVALDNAGNRSVKKARFRTCSPQPG